VSHTDITDRKHVENALGESEGRLQLFIEYAPAALAMFDRRCVTSRPANAGKMTMGLAVSAILPVSRITNYFPISRTLEVYSRSRARGGSHPGE